MARMGTLVLHVPRTASFLVGLLDQHVLCTISTAKLGASSAEAGTQPPTLSPINWVVLPPCNITAYHRGSMKACT